MSLRIIAGVWKGRSIPSPVTQLTRPSTDMWRNALFSALTHHVDLDGAVVWDLYAGTGALGLETLSRGAAHCTFVEHSAKSCQQIQHTLQEFSAAHRACIKTSTVSDFLRASVQAHVTPLKPTLILADPPYDARVGNSLLSQLALCVELDCLLVYEHGTSEALLPSECWENVWHKEHGGTIMEFLRRVG